MTDDDQTIDLKEQDVNLSVVDGEEWNEQREKILKVKDMLAEEGVIDDPELLKAFTEAVDVSLTGKTLL